MYARLQTVANRPPADDPDGAAREFTELIPSHPGFAGLALLEAAGGAGTLLTLWRTRQDAEPAAGRTAAVRGPRPAAPGRDEIFEIDDDLTGPAAARPAGAALVGHFDGPLSEARVAAARRGGRERLAPALRHVPGLVRTLVLWHPERRAFVVVHLVTAVDALEDVVTAVTTTELLPGEDPALLTGPDRVGPHRVLSYLAVAPAAR